MMKPKAPYPVITIDGAGGTGKGAVMQAVASKLGWHQLDSGALYRLLALAAEQRNVALTDAEALVALAHDLDVQFIDKGPGVAPTIMLFGQDVTYAIRTELMGNAASKLGTLAHVRDALLARQRAFRKAPGLVTDGRDMGTVVFPDAVVKIFLTASPTVQAERRRQQLLQQGIHVNLARLVEELTERSRRDQERAVAPMKPAADAICIDTDPLTLEQVVERVMSEVKRVMPKA